MENDKKIRKRIFMKALSTVKAVNEVDSVLDEIGINLDFDNTEKPVGRAMGNLLTKPVFPTVINAREIISVDLGLKEFGVFGNLEESIPIPNPRWIKIHAKRLRRFQ